ncbi:MAG: biopolymer transporter ExbD [Verrucomicrobiota bacterium]
MNFYQKRRRTPALQIISMIDILIILLIFLVVSTSFKEMQTALNVSLPSSREMALGTAPVDGRISLSVTGEEKIHLADAEVSAIELPDALAKMKTARPDAKLELRMDEKVSLGLMMKLWDALTKAGFKVNDVPVRALRAQDKK